MKTPLAILAVAILAGCSTTATLIPIHGPLASAGAPEIKATVAAIPTASWCAGYENAPR